MWTPCHEPFWKRRLACDLSPNHGCHSSSSILLDVRSSARFGIGANLKFFNMSMCRKLYGTTEMKTTLLKLAPTVTATSSQFNIRDAAQKMRRVSSHPLVSHGHSKHKRIFSYNQVLSEKLSNSAMFLRALPSFSLRNRLAVTSLPCDREVPLMPHTLTIACTNYNVVKDLPQPPNITYGAWDALSTARLTIFTMTGFSPKSPTEQILDSG